MNSVYFWSPAMALWQREVLRFVRQRNRVIGALATPILFWILLGSGLSPSFHSISGKDHVDYLAYFFPGILALIILFTAIFSTMSLIEDRKEGFLQGVLAAPVAPGAIVLGKLLGGMTLAVIQAALCCLLAPFVGIHIGPTQSVKLLMAFALMGFSLTGLGMSVAWMMDSIQGYHAIMNVFLVPMWILSGAVFPLPEGFSWLRMIAVINPVTYGVASIRAAMGSSADTPFVPYFLGIFVSVVFCIAMYALSAMLVSRIRKA